MPDPSFAFTYGQAIVGRYSGYSIDTCSNDAVVDSTVLLDEYFAVIWLVGDETEKDETFSSIEQLTIRSYLKKYGRLLVSGANITWDLDLDSNCYSTTKEDNEFFELYHQGRFCWKNCNE